MKIMVTGVAGQLGHDVVKELAAHHIEWIGTDASALDITDKVAVYNYIHKEKPDGVIHCAAYTAVDKAEDDEDTCYAVNVEGTKYIAEACKAVGAKLMYISTDYVFPGTGENYYATDAPKGPTNVYGKTKLDGELVVQELLDEYFIVRISWVFGSHGNNFVKTMLRLSETKTEISVVGDQIGGPTYTYDLAKLLVAMIQSDKYGVYHAPNEGVCSWAEFAREIFRLANKNVIVHSVSSADYPTRAKRPLNSRLDTSNLEANGFAKLPRWEDALSRYIKEIVTL